MRPGIAILLSTSMLALLLAFLFAARGAGAREPARGAGFWDQRTEEFIRSKVAYTYVDELDDRKSREAFYRAMDAYVNLDKYCDYIPPEEHKRWQEDTAGRYAGLGVKINKVEEGLHVVGVFPNGPASKAGILVGDTIVRAAGRNLAGMDVEDITKLLKGAPRSKVRVSVIRGPRPEEGPVSGPEVEFEVTRDLIRPPTVFTRRLGDEKQFLHIRLSEFAEETADAFNREMDKLLEKEPAKGVILDLRDNGGGVLGVAVSVADRFLRKGRNIVRMEGRSADASRTYHATSKQGKLLDIPLVVLVNGWSASASEVVAGALQDHRRGVLVGTHTFGKFLVQSITTIPPYRRGGTTLGAVKLTTSRYYTPSGRSYQSSSRKSLPGQFDPDDEDALPDDEGTGLVPDVVIRLPKEDALDLRRLWLDEEGRFWGEKRHYPELSWDYVDAQVQRALELLGGQLVMQRIKPGSRAKRRNG